MPDLARIAPNKIATRLFDEEFEKAKQVKGAPQPAALPSIPFDKSTAFAGGSLQPVDSSSLDLRRPTVQPKLAPLYSANSTSRVLQCFQRFEGLADQNIQLVEEETKGLSEWIKEQEQQLVEAVREDTKIGQTESTWHVWETALSCLVTIGSFALGATLLATNRDRQTAFSLLAAAGFGVASLTISKAEELQALLQYITASVEKQSNIAARLQQGFLLLSTGLALTGAALIVRNDQLTTVFCVERIKRITPIALSILQAINQLVTANIKRKSCDAQGRIIRITTEISNSKREMSQRISEPQGLWNSMDQFSKVVKQMIQDLTILFQ